MSKIKEHFGNKTGEQIVSFFMFVFTVAIMFFCLIARFFGILWFKADLNKINIPSEFLQEFIKSGLLVFELIFIYKILCRTSWWKCLFIAIIQTIIVAFFAFVIKNNIATSIFNLVYIAIIPIFFVKKWYSFLENLLLCGITMLYGIIFSVGRIGIFANEAAYNFLYGILGTIDYKLFIVSLYLFIKYNGGFRLWKKQKRLIFQTDPKTQ